MSNLTFETLGEIIKTSYPGTYDDLTNREVGEALVKKYPEFEKDLASFERSYGSLVKTLPSGLWNDAKELVGGVIGVVSEGGKDFIESIKQMPNLINDIKELQSIAKEQGTTSWQLVKDNAIDPAVGNVGKALKQEYIAPEGVSQVEFLLKRALDKPLSSALDVSIVGGLASKGVSTSGKLAKLTQVITPAQLDKIIKFSNTIEKGTNPFNLLLKIKDGKLASKVKTEIASQAKAAGLTEADITSISGLSDEFKKIALEFIDQAEVAAKDRTALTVTEAVGSKLNTFQSKLSELVKKTGQELGAAVDKTKGNKTPKLGMGSVLKSLTDILRQKNVTISSKGKLNFKKSDFGLIQDQKIISELWDFVKPTQKQFGAKVTERFHPIRDVIAKYRNLGNKLKYNSLQGFSASENIVNLGRKQLTELVSNMRGKIGELNAKFSELSSANQSLNKAIKAKGVKAPEFIRRAFSSVSSEPKSILSQMKAIAEKYNIPEGKNIFQEGNIAMTAENAAGVTKANSLAGQQIKAGQAVSNMVSSGTKQGIGSIISQYIGGKVNKYTEPLKVSGPEAFRSIVTSTKPASFSEKLAKAYPKVGVGIEVSNAIPSSLKTVVKKAAPIVNSIASIKKKAKNDNTQSSQVLSKLSQILSNQ